MATSASLLSLLNRALAAKKGITKEEKELARLRERLAAIRGQGLVCKVVELSADVEIVRAADVVLNYFRGPALVQLLGQMKSSNSTTWAWIDQPAFQQDQQAYVEDPEVLRNLVHSWRNTGAIPVSWLHHPQLERVGFLTGGYVLDCLEPGYPVRLALHKLGLLQTAPGTGIPHSTSLYPTLTYEQYDTIIIKPAQKQKQQASERIAMATTAIVEGVTEGSRQVTDEVAARQADLAHLKAQLKSSLEQLRAMLHEAGEGDDGTDVASEVASILSMVMLDGADPVVD